MEKVRENMEKTGNTPFEFENLTIAMKDAIFLPMKSLNQLRRDALEGLEKLCVEQFRREVEQVDRAGMKAQESTAYDTREIFVCSDRAEMSVTAAFGE